MTKTYIITLKIDVKDEKAATKLAYKLGDAVTAAGACMLEELQVKDSEGKDYEV